MRIQPQSTVTLYSGVDIDFSSGIEIAFSNISNQRAYFASKVARTDTPCTVVKKTGRIRLEAPGSLVKNCNYISFVNPSFDNKTIYGMILDYFYINNECTEISYQIDFWQSWMFDIDFEKSGIVRQYLNETDYALAEANPYDPRIYAFQTPEQLPYDKTLEVPYYTYRIYSQSGNDFENTLTGVNGYYPMLCMNNDNEDDALDDLRGLSDPISYCFMIAPINFDDLGGSAGDTYTHFCQHITEHTNGLYIEANKDSAPEMLWSMMPHPFDIFIIPKNATPKDSSVASTAPMELIQYLTTWNAIGQIISIYAVPTYAVPYMTIFYDTTPGRDYADFDNEDVFSLKTSYALRNMGTEGGSYAPHCQKLYTSPYSYIRVETPDGDIKEYKYEEFIDVVQTTNPSNEVKFRVCSTLNGKPTILLLPNKYKSRKALSTRTHQGGGSGNHEQYTPDIACNFNLDERMELNSFPQIAFTTDGFLTHLSASYMATVAGNTSQAQAEREYGKYQNDLAMNSAGYDMINEGRIGSTINGAVEGFAKGGPIGAFIGAGGGYLGGMRAENDVLSRAAAADFAYENTYGVQKEMLAEASNFLSNPSKDNPRFNDTKPAFANNQYHPGSMGDSMYLKYAAINDFKITKIKLRDAVLQKYDEYFKTYGYNFGATVDVPYVVRYTQGASSNDDLPHWEKVNGKDSTFVKTHDCHITHSMLPVSVAIEGMFNCGVRMLKGETL